MAVTMKNAVFWDVAQFSSCMNRCSRKRHSLISVQLTKSYKSRIGPLYCLCKGKVKVKLSLYLTN
jgi:hypothetical protein